MSMEEACMGKGGGGVNWLRRRLFNVWGGRSVRSTALSIIVFVVVLLTFMGD